MDLSPPLLTRSPSSPSKTYSSSDRSSLDYPSPSLVEQHYKLGSIYGDPSCSMAPRIDPDTLSPPPLDAMNQTEWSHAIHATASAPSSFANVLSTGFDAYSSYESYLVHPISYRHHIYHTQSAHSSSTIPASATPASAPAAAIATVASTGTSSTALPSAGALARSVAASAFVPSSSRTPLSFTAGAGTLIKMESTPEYGHAQDMAGPHYPSPRSAHTSFLADGAAFPANRTAADYGSDSGSSTWNKIDYRLALEANQYYNPHGSQPPSFAHNTHTRRPPYHRVTRPRRTPRHLTSKEEANFQCEIEGCGKLFSRSYNYKAHMETHDEKREYPFPCLVDDCSKRFVRKTDLQRHHQSVHMKERNHKCDFCARHFARKDTLRRHMEDGCAKRFDIGTLDWDTDTYENLGQTTEPISHRPRHTLAVSGSLQTSPPALSMAPIAHGNVPTSTSQPIRGRELLAGADHLMVPASQAWIGQSGADCLPAQSSSDV